MREVAYESRYSGVVAALVIRTASPRAFLSAADAIERKGNELLGGWRYGGTGWIKRAVLGDGTAGTSILCSKLDNPRPYTRAR